MPVSSLYRFFAPLVLLAYLLVGSGLAHALVWCVDESGHSHVEFNPAGDCQLACESDNNLPGSPLLPGLNSEKSESGCQDVILLSSQAKNSRVSSPVPQLAAIELPLPTSGTLVASLHRPRPPCRSDQLPPRTALASLRTVVLLN